MHKILLFLAGLNTLALLGFIIAYFVVNSGKHVDSMESGWFFILVCLGLLIILLGVLPLYYGHSTFSQVVGVFFTVLPLAIGFGVIISNALPSMKREKSFAETYYKNKNQMAIASAIENNDTLSLKKLIRGENLNIHGIKVWDWPGLNYLQFAVRLGSNPTVNFKKADNIAAIRILIAEGCDATPALDEATQYLPAEIIADFLTAGANPNVCSLVNGYPILFRLIGNRTKQQNDIAILLIRSGANVNAKGDNGFTPVMFAAFEAGTDKKWSDTWRVVRYLLEDAGAIYGYTTAEGYNLANIIEKISLEAEAQKIIMPTDFDKVVVWLKQHNVDTMPILEN